MSLDVNSSFGLPSGQITEQISYTDAKEAFQKNSNWGVVFASFDLPDFQASPIWISKKTGISVEEVVEAIEGLVTLGFLSKQSGAIYPVKEKGFAEFSWDGKTKSQIIDEHTLVSQQILNKLDEKSTLAHDLRCFTANKEILTELYQDISNALNKAFEKSKQNKENNDGIYQFTFTAVDVAKKSISNGREN